MLTTSHIIRIMNEILHNTGVEAAGRRSLRTELVFFSFISALWQPHSNNRTQAHTEHTKTLPTHNYIQPSQRGIMGDPTTCFPPRAFLGTPPSVSRLNAKIWNVNNVISSCYDVMFGHTDTRQATGDIQWKLGLRLQRRLVSMLNSTMDLEIVYVYIYLSIDCCFCLLVLSVVLFLFGAHWEPLNWSQIKVLCNKYWLVDWLTESNGKPRGICCHCWLGKDFTAYIFSYVLFIWL